MMKKFLVSEMIVLLLLPVFNHLLANPFAGATVTHKTFNNVKDTSGYDTGSVFKGSLLRDIVFATKTNFKGTQQSLALDIYKPANAENKKFPAIILIHGGSFRGGDKNNLYSPCSKLANNGYVVVSVNYRLGWGFVSKQSASCADTIKLKQAIYRAVQDAHSALDFIVAHADEYNIDKDEVFIGGQSAGAITALLTAFLKLKDSQDFFPQFSKEFDSLYKDSVSANNHFKLKGVISMWGAFVNPELITSETALPTIFFQGMKDKAVPFYSNTFTPCANTSMVYGSHPLYNRLKDLGETAIVHADPEGGHGVYEENFRIINILCFLNDVRKGVKKQLYLTGTESSCGK